MNPKSNHQLKYLSLYQLKILSGLIREFMFALILLLLFLFLNESVTAGGNQLKPQDTSRVYVFISDTQELLKAEYLWNVSNNNLAMTRLMFADIVELKPRSVFHMGDLVAEGYVNISWNTIDNFLDELEDEDIPFYPVMGNHELIALPDRGEKNFQNRFPQHSRTGYSVQVDSLAVLLQL